MDADETLTALKKAYADIILNTAKEAAARIMLSERKATRFEYELKNAKEDAIQMLWRLKQMMDLKVNEAAVTFSIQQKKIEELEAQLQEAEQIVEDLRDELSAVEAKLERFSRSNEVKHAIQVDNASTRNILKTPESVSVHPEEVRSNSNIDQSNQSQRACNSLFPLKKSLFGNGDLPSIILRNKETELYRNGCTQRIRACELTPPDKKLSFPVQMDVLKAESVTKEDEVLKCNIEKKEVVLDQEKEIILAADNSYATSTRSAKQTNDTGPEEKSNEGRTFGRDLVISFSSQSTIREERMPIIQEKEESSRTVEPQVDSLLASNTSEIPRQQMNDRVIRYTFQRKRKRGYGIDGSATSKRIDENQTVHLGTGNAKLIGESIPEKIRLEQVARQLISLSDR